MRRWIAALALLVVPSAAAAAGPVVALGEALRLAAQHNPDLAIARETIARADGLRLQAWLALGPTVTLTGSYTRNEDQIALDPRFFNPASTEAPIVIQAQDQLAGNLHVHQPILAPSLLVTVAAAGVRRDVARLDYAQARQELVLRAARAYYDILAARGALAVARSTRATREQHVEAQRVRLRNGAATETAVLQGELDLDDADRQVIEAEAALSLARDTLRLLCGLGADFEVDEPPVRAVPRVEAAALVDEAVARRPDLRSATMLVENKGIVRWEARARWLPEIAGDLNVNASNAPGFAGTDVFWTASLTATWVLEGARFVEGRLRESDVREAEARQRRGRDQVEAEVRAALTEVVKADRRRELARRQVEMARRNEELVRTAFAAGGATPLELSDAGQRRLATETGEITSRYALAVALLSLDVALGTEL